MYCEWAWILGGFCSPSTRCQNKIFDVIRIEKYNLKETLKGLQIKSFDYNLSKGLVILLSASSARAVPRRPNVFMKDQEQHKGIKQKIRHRNKKKNANISPSLSAASV